MYVLFVLYTFCMQIEGSTKPVLINICIYIYIYMQRQSAMYSGSARLLGSARLGLARLGSTYVEHILYTTTVGHQYAR